MASPDHRAHGEPDPARRRWSYDTVCALVFVALGIILFLSIPYQVARPLMMFGQMASGLQPQRFPQMVAAFLVDFGLRQPPATVRAASLGCHLADASPVPDNRQS
jgi:hypothetical protein